MDNTQTIDNLISASFNNFSTNKKMSTNNGKCSRDLKYILEAIFKDVENDTTIFTNRIANRFWYDGRRQLKTYDIEIKVYKFMLSELEKKLDLSSYQKAKRSVDLLINIVINGPEITDIGTKLVQDVLKAEHCQRNWDHTHSMPESDLDTLIKVATTMPAKQNRDYYKLIVSTDREFNSIAHSLSRDLDNPDTPGRNSQVNANTLFIYIKNLNFGNGNGNTQFVDNHQGNVNTAVGISSGGLALAASQLDYRVGFCQCFLNDELKIELRKKDIILADDEDIKLLVGVGKPNTNFTWNQTLNSSETLLENIVPYQKSIKVFKF